MTSDYMRRFHEEYRRQSRISPQQLAARGWTCVYRGLGKSAEWQHRDGWFLQHCGHPTANWPWALYDPGGFMVCQPSGHAWRTLAAATRYVEEANQEKEKS